MLLTDTGTCVKPRQSHYMTGMAVVEVTSWMIVLLMPWQFYYRY